jgi:DNA-binding MarR family transcriptional regulator
MPRPRSARPPVDELLGAAAAVIRWAERVLATHEPALTLAQFLALRSIGREPVTAAALARRAGVSGPAASQLVSGVERAGWIARTPFEHDRRSHELTLTASGAGVLASATQALSERLGPLLAGLPPPELHALERALPLVEATLGGNPPPRRPRPPHPPEGPRPGRR